MLGLGGERMKGLWNKRLVYIREQQRNVILTCFFLFFVPFTILFSVLSIKESESSKKAYTASREEVNKQIQLSFDNILMSINRISYLHISDAKAGAILQRSYESKGQQYVQDSIYMNTLIDNLLQMNPLFYDITFISGSDEVFGSINATDENKKYIEETIRHMEEEELNYYVAPASVRTVMQQKKVLFSSMVRLSDYDRRTAGYLLVDIDFRDIQKIIDSVDHSFSKVLLTGTDSILASNDEEYKGKESVGARIFQKVSSTVGGTEEAFQRTIQIDGRQYTCLVQPVTSIQANIIQYYENPSYFMEFFKKQGLAFLSGFILMLLVLALISRNSTKIFRPIEVLIAGMKETGKGNFKQIELVGNIYEINLIIERFNKMIVQLEQAVNENYVSKINQKNIELKMLQAQINPHFIYNTLNLISATAILNDVEEISYISDKLSSLLRYNIKKGDIVLIREEMEQVRNYLYIQSVRFSNRIEEEIEVEEELLSCSVLKFLLQPLVENCIFHGLELSGGQGRIRISITRQGEDMMIKVSDNGVGMPEEKLKFLRGEMEKASTFQMTTKDETSIGIKNVASRIRAFYGENYYLKIESQEGVGTSFCMKLPVHIASGKEEAVEDFSC